MVAAAARVDRGRRPRASRPRSSSHPLRRRRPAGARPAGRRTRGAPRAVRGRRRARGHHARGDRPTAASTGFSDDEIELFADMTRRRRPPAQLERAHRRLAASPSASRASSRPATRAARGRRPHRGLTMPVLVADEHELPQLLRAVPASPAGATILRPAGARAHRRSCSEPDGPAADARAGRQRQEAGVFRRLADFGRYVIGDTYSEANEGLKGRGRRRHRRRAGPGPVRHARRHRASTTTCARSCGPCPPTTTTVVGAAPPRLWDDDRAMLGGSDAGAHLDRMCGAPYTDPLPRRLPPRPQARAARAGGAAASPRRRPELFGLRDRGALARGLPRRPRRVRPRDRRRRARPTLVHDLPGDTPRLTADSIGVVAGARQRRRSIVVDGKPTGALPGTVLRSGRDTDTVATR